MPGHLPAAVLAHQGGWDELLFVLAPILLFVVLLFLANRRANAMSADRDGVADDDRATPAGTGDGTAGNRTE